jgi:predicted Zn-dependent protease
LEESDHTALDEILARLLEEKIGLALGLAVHTSEEQVRELMHYPVKITVEQYEHLRRKWQQQYWPAKDVGRMATYTLNYLRRKV